MATIIELQELINEKARRKLHDDLKNLVSVLRDNRLLGCTNSDSIPDVNYGGKEQKLFWLLKPGSKFMDAVTEYWLPIYQNEEAQVFLQKVEDLNNDVAELMDSKNYD